MSIDRIERVKDGLIRNRSKLLRVIHSASDFQFALSALIWFRELLDSNEMHTSLQIRKMRCFEAAAIISLARPFTKFHGGTTLSIKAINLNLGEEDKKLLKKVEAARDKFVAHADEEEMNFHVDPELFEMPNSNDIYVPFLTFDEGFIFTYDEIMELELLLRRLLSAIHKTIWTLAQKYPKEMSFYKSPDNSREHYCS